MTDKYADETSPSKQKHQPKMKTVKFHLNIGDADRDRLIKRAEEFLLKHSQVKVIVQLRGREKAHPYKGVEFLNMVMKELSHVGSPANNPNASSLFITFNPKKHSK